jgi:hypothetical protein
LQVRAGAAALAALVVGRADIADALEIDELNGIAVGIVEVGVSPVKLRWPLSSYSSTSTPLASTCASAASKSSGGSRKAWWIKVSRSRFGGVW